MLLPQWLNPNLSLARRRLVGCIFRIYPRYYPDEPIYNHDLLQSECSLVPEIHSLDKDKVVDEGEVEKKLMSMASANVNLGWRYQTRDDDEDNNSKPPSQT
eukprot:213083_1